MPNYTKGDWKVYPTNHFNDKGRSFKIATGAANEAIALIDWGGHQFFNGNFEELKANAYLISAAPSLYEALKNIMSERHDDWSPMYKQAMKALSKADSSPHRKGEGNGI